MATKFKKALLKGAFLSFIVVYVFIIFDYAKNYNMVSQESKDLKLLFIEEELSQHGEWLCDILQQEIEKKRLKDSGSLLNSLNYSSFKSGNNPGLRVNFMSYGRAIDINAYKKNRHSVDVNREIWGMKENRRKQRKSSNWYAINMYGGLNKLISRIMYGLTDEEIARLKGILSNRKNISV